MPRAPRPEPPRLPSGLCAGAQACARRTAAVAKGDLKWDRRQRAWVFPKDPLRWMSEAARYYAMVEREAIPFTDHSGAFFSWADCPFCGRELPDLAADAERDALTYPPPEDEDDGN